MTSHATGDLAAAWPEGAWTAVAATLLSGIVAGWLWCFSARRAGLERWQCLITALVPASLVHSALPMEYVFPFEDVFSKMPLDADPSLIALFSRGSALGSSLAAALGCVLGFFLERVLPFRSSSAPDLPNHRTTLPWLAGAVLLSVAALDYVAYQRFVQDYVGSFLCVTHRCDLDWTPLQRAVLAPDAAWSVALRYAYRPALHGWPEPAELRLPLAVLRTAGQLLVAASLAYLVVRRRPGWRRAIELVVLLVLVASVLWGLAHIERATLYVLAPRGGSKHYAPVVLGLIATSAVGWLGSAFFALVRGEKTLLERGPWLVSWMLFSLTLRFSLEHATSTDRFFVRQDVDLLLSRFWSERALCFAAGVSLLAASCRHLRLPGWRFAGPKDFARAAFVLGAGALLLLTRPHAADAGIMLSPDDAVYESLSSVERCAAPLPASGYLIGLRGVGSCPNYLEDPVGGGYCGEREPVARLTNLLRVRLDLARASGQERPDPLVVLGARLGTLAASARNVLEGAAGARYDVVIAVQRTEPVPARTVKDVTRIAELCSAGTIRLSLEDGAPIPADWTLRDLIRASRERPYDPRGPAQR